MPGDSALLPKAPSTDFGETLASPTPAALLDALAAIRTEAPTGAAQFGKYKVIGELGEGGMGRVYKAVDTELGRVVAVKVLRSADPFECSRFRGEAEMIAALDHPNIVKVFDIATPPDGRPYIVLEFCDGGSLDKELGGHPIEPRRAAETAETLARAVQFAHEKGVIHRDLKPANILRTRDKQLKLTDFGLAKEMEVSSGMTPSNAVMGTPSYMSPEQAEGKVKQLGPASDVYGLGAILYELLTGRPPFRGVNMADTLEQVRWAEPAPPSQFALRLPRDLSTICLKCLQKTPSRRYATAGELADDLRRWMNGEVIAARRAPSWERLVRQVKRRPWEAATAVALVLLVALAAAAAVVRAEWQREKQDERERQAIKEQSDDALRIAAAAAAAKLQAEQRDHADLLRARGSKSRDALDAILRRVLSPELRRMPGLHGLHGELAGYYKQHIAESLADDKADRAELARLAYQIGDLAHQSGRLGTAEELFAQARALYTQLAAADPSHRPRAGDAAVKVARVVFDSGRDDPALAVAAEAEAVWRPLADAPDRTPARDHAKLRLAELAHLRGEVLRRRHQLEPAAAAFTDSIGLREEVAKDYRAMRHTDIAAMQPPERRERAIQALRDLGRGYGFRGDEYMRLARAPDADHDYWSSHHIREKVMNALAAVPDPRAEDRAELEVAQMQFARSWMNLARFQARTRAYTTARQHTAKASELNHKLVLVSPNNAEYRRDLCQSLAYDAEFMLLERPDGYDRKAVLELLKTAIDLEPATEEAVRERSFNTRETLALAHALRAEVLADADPATAKSDVAHVSRFLDHALEKYPADPRFRFQRAAMLALAADLDAVPPADPRWSAARGELEKALKGEYREQHPDDIPKRRYFKRLKDDDGFKAAFAARRD